MNLIELNSALRQLRLGGIAAVLETRLHQAQAEPMAPIDFIWVQLELRIVNDEILVGEDRTLGIVDVALLHTVPDSDSPRDRVQFFPRLLLDLRHRLPAIFPGF